jgi:hypothetical protein
MLIAIWLNSHRQDTLPCPSGTLDEVFWGEDVREVVTEA